MPTLVGDGIVNVGKDASSRDGDVAEYRAELFVIAPAKHDVSGGDTLLLIVLGPVACQVEGLRSQVLQDGCKEDWGACPDPPSVEASLQMTVYPADWEYEPGPNSTRLSLPSSTADDEHPSRGRRAEGLAARSSTGK
jgi:hypothetical protein